VEEVLYVLPPPGDRVPAGLIQAPLEAGGHRPVPRVGWAALVGVLQSSFDVVLLPYHLPGHYIVLELCFRGGEGGPYIKVWDGMDTWRESKTHNIAELSIIREVFFRGSTTIPVRKDREQDDPEQTEGLGCAAFAFMVICHRALGQYPKGWTSSEEALARNYMWNCIIHSTILPFPKRIIK